MEVLYHGFDGLDIAFQGQIPPDLDTLLETAKAEAVDRRDVALVDYNGLQLLVAETGARGGYAYRCDTGPEGATWFFKRPNRRDPYGIRVSVKSLPLALYGLGGVRAQLARFLEALGLPSAMQTASIGRVDYAIDVLAPVFLLEPENFVMHSHTTRATHRESLPVTEHGRSGRVTSVTIGKMPGRQVIVYDKRAEVIAKRKVEWWKIWNAARRQAGKPNLDSSDPDTSRVWRVELRAGKTHLKERWGISDWPSFDTKLGDLLRRATVDIRYATPSSDLNRARWADHAIWTITRREVDGDLFEMACGADPGVVREVIRQEHLEMLTSQVEGLAATISHLKELPDDKADLVAGYIAQAIESKARNEAKEFQAKRQRAAERYYFIDTLKNSQKARP